MLTQCQTLKQENIIVTPVSDNAVSNTETSIHSGTPVSANSVTALKQVQSCDCHASQFDDVDTRVQLEKKRKKRETERENKKERQSVVVLLTFCQLHRVISGGVGMGVKETRRKAENSYRTSDFYVQGSSCLIQRT